jgi:mxaJ protein
VQRVGQPPISSFDDPALRSAQIGVQLIGDDGVNTPPVEELSRRGLGLDLHSYMVFGDLSQPYPLSPIVDAVAKGEVDVAIAWGPGAGYFAAKQETPLQVTAVDEAGTSVPMSFGMAIGVRKDDADLATALQQAMERRRDEIAAILDRYHVPRSEGRPQIIEIGTEP